MVSFLEKIFKKEEVIDFEKIKDQARLSFEASQFDKNLFLQLSIKEDLLGEYVDYLKTALALAPEEQIPVKEEMENLKQFISCFSLAHNHSSFYKFEIKGLEDIGESVQFSPFLLFPLVRNAFYFGYNSMEKFPVRIRIHIQRNFLKMEVSNRVNHHLMNQESNEELDWFKMRLQLLFPEKHTLLFNSNSSLFKATMQLEF